MNTSGQTSTATSTPAATTPSTLCSELDNCTQIEVSVHKGTLNIRHSGVLLGHVTVYPEGRTVASREYGCQHQPCLSDVLSAYRNGPEQRVLDADAFLGAIPSGMAHGDCVTLTVPRRHTWLGEVQESRGAAHNHEELALSPEEKSAIKAILAEAGVYITVGDTLVTRYGVTRTDFSGLKDDNRSNVTPGGWYRHVTRDEHGWPCTFSVDLRPAFNN